MVYGRGWAHTGGWVQQGGSVTPGRCVGPQPSISRRFGALLHIITLLIRELDVFPGGEKAWRESKYENFLVSRVCGRGGRVCHRSLQVFDLIHGSNHGFVTIVTQYAPIKKHLEQQRCSAPKVFAKWSNREPCGAGVASQSNRCSK
jgi:hypothetical protein